MRFVNFLVATALACTGCSSATSTIKLEGKPTLEAEIIAGRADTIVVLPVNGVESEIPRSEILEVDHPGTGNMWIGILGVTFGLLMIPVGVGIRDTPDGDEEVLTRIGRDVNGSLTIVAGGLLALGGAALFGYGLWEESESKERYDSRKPDERDAKPIEERLVFSPYASRDGAGLTVGLSF